MWNEIFIPSKIDDIGSQFLDGGWYLHEKQRIDGQWNVSPRELYRILATFMWEIKRGRKCKGLIWVKLPKGLIL